MSPFFFAFVEALALAAQSCFFEKRGSPAGETKGFTLRVHVLEGSLKGSRRARKGFYIGLRV